MRELQIIDEHITIRETCGYDGIKDVPVYDMPQVLHFLKICHNYMKLQNIQDGKH